MTIDHGWSRDSVKGLAKLAGRHWPERMVIVSLLGGRFREALRRRSRAGGRLAFLGLGPGDHATHIADAIEEIEPERCTERGRETGE